jgi:PilZ domain-containing protein
MSVAWYGGGDQQVSRVKTLGMGGVFVSVCRVRPVGTSLTLVFEVPGGIVQAEGVVRSVSPDEGMGVEFTKMGPQDRALLEKLLQRLLR